MDAEERADGDKVARLLDALLSEENLTKLLLASTTEVAASIARDFPQFVELQLLGDMGARAVAERIARADEKELMPLLALAERMPSSTTLDAVAHRLAQWEGDAPLEKKVLARAFAAISLAQRAEYAEELVRQARDLVGHR